MKISRPEECCLAIGIVHREKGKGVAPGLNELLVRGGQLCGWDSDHCDSKTQGAEGLILHRGAQPLCLTPSGTGLKQWSTLGCRKRSIFHGCHERRYLLPLPLCKYIVLGGFPVLYHYCFSFIHCLHLSLFPS